MSLNVDDFKYDLPKERIPTHPLPDRSQSKLLIYNAGKIEHATFSSLADFLPGKSLLFFNDTKVIPARLLFKTRTGAAVEIFLLEPVSPSTLVVEAMLNQGISVWKCAVGNLKRWKYGTTLSSSKDGLKLDVYLKDRATALVQFSWNADLTFASIIEQLGEVPLPPYIKRVPDERDKVRYQTIYSVHEGAVAAPTAGLHFTKDTFDSLRSKNIETDYLTLHVSAGTFQPIKTANISEHQMHEEQVIVSLQNLKNLRRNKFIVAVGTTSMRTLESLYWFGVKLLRDPSSEFVVDQGGSYKGSTDLPSKDEALTAVQTHMKKHDLTYLDGRTSIFITPGYTFKMCQGLITNFHMPASTLILLVAAFIGPDWRKVYASALKNDYRFLSYGDSSLLLPEC